MNPIVVIASHQRIKITRQNIKSLLNQSFVPQIVLVVSDNEEVGLFRREFPEITVKKEHNFPLGRKWQAGVDVAQTLQADPLIITGSDDILGTDFVKNACDLVNEFDFIGILQWYVWHSGYLYKMNYNAKMPLGGGRVYSKSLLDKLNWKLFDTALRRHLDDYGWHQTLAVTSKILPVENVDRYGLQLVSVKGGWPVMNDFKRMLSHPNCSVVYKERGDETLLKLIGFKPVV